MSNDNYSILYSVDGAIFKFGEFKTEVEAINHVRGNKEFDILSQRIYLLHPDHRMTEFYMNDILTKESV